MDTDLVIDEGFVSTRTRKKKPVQPPTLGSLPSGPCHEDALEASAGCVVSNLWSEENRYISLRASASSVRALYTIRGTLDLLSAIGVSMIKIENN